MNLLMRWMVRRFSIRCPDGERHRWNLEPSGNRWPTKVCLRCPERRSTEPNDEFR